MIAVIFHFWLGVILVLSAAAITVALIGGYVKSVTAAKFPAGKRNPEEN
ncbi:MAG: hypothetical protein ABIW84_09075 [Ilumatobacteraceae bacterium]